MEDHVLFLFGVMSGMWIGALAGILLYRAMWQTMRREALEEVTTVVPDSTPYFNEF